MANKIDVDKVRELRNKSALRTQAERYSYERDWFRNVLFLLGIQWITYSPSTRKWKPRKIDKWVPRPVTNKFAPIAMSMIQVMSQKDPVVRARAGGDDPADIAAAAVADKNFGVILKEAEAKEARRLAAAWKALTGSAIYHPNYDNDPIYGTTFVQHMLCQTCQKTFAPDQEPAEKPMPQGEMGGQDSGAQQGPVCPFCGSPNVMDGPPGVGENLPNGKCNIEVFSPFETFMTLEGKSWKSVSTLIARRRYDLDTIKRKYGRDDLEPDNNSNTGGAIGLNLLRAIAYAAGNTMYGTGIASGRGIGDDESITLDQLWVRPCSEYPEGLVAVFANDQCINEDDLKEGIPYRKKDGNPIWPWHLSRFDLIPGRMLGRTPLDDVAGKQEQRNKLEALIHLIVTRCANPLWLIAKGIGITPITGEPGQVVEGNWAMNPLLKPERVSGDNIPTSLIAWLEKTDKDMEEVGGIFEVLKGSAPPGVTAGTALRLLLERAYTRFTPVAQQDEETWQEVCQDLLVIFQQFGTAERINKIQGPGNTWEINRFRNADIDGSIDIIVEAGSSLPKSAVGEQALIQDMIAMKLINPMDPQVQYKILQTFGKTDLLGDTDLNIRAAQRENWDFINQGVMPEIDIIIDMHPAHVQVHKQLALTSDYRTWPKPVRLQWCNHILEHMMAMAPALPQPGAEGGEGESKNPGEGKETKPAPETQTDQSIPEPAGGMIM